MIEANALCKSFGQRIAVNKVSLKVKRGEVLGFLGPNGAGKSTTMRMLTGFLEPDSGSVSLGGISLAENPVIAKKKFGYLPENAPSYGDMTVSGFLKFCAGARSLPNPAAAVEQAIQTCFLQTVRHQTIETLSKGFRHRVCLAQAILHDPEILILDEPTDGLDPNQKHEVRTLIRRMGQSKAIIFSTHILEEVEAVCHRALIIDRGTIVANGTPSELKAKATSAGQILLQPADPSLAEKFAASIRQLDSCSNSTATNGFVRSQPAKNHSPAALAKDIKNLAIKESWDFIQLKIEEGRLDDVFRSLTSRDTSENQ